MSYVELDWLKRWAQITPEKVAIKDVSRQREYSYQELYSISQGVASYLREQGVGPGERVAVFANNSVETIILFFSLVRLGAILVPINFRLSTSELNYILQDSHPLMLIVDASTMQAASPVDCAILGCRIVLMQELGDVIESARRSLDRVEFRGEFEDPAMILYTSGTTGNPKGVVISHKILFWNSVNTSISLNITSEDSMVSFLPLFHTGGWNVLLTPFIHRGASFVFIPAFDAEKILALCESEKLTILFGVPTTLAMMAKTETFSNVNMSSLRFVVVGGEPMPLELIQTWHKKGVPVRQGFGLTECGPNCFSLSHEDAETKIGSIGRPNFYVDVRVVDKEYKDVPYDEIGELLLRGPMCMQEYWRNQKSSREAFVEGWLKTGDLVRRDSQNYFYVVGRKKEMFISGGENVYPAEVEKVLRSHEFIEEAAVVGVPDVKWGEVGKAFIVAKANAKISSEQLTLFCVQHLAKFKIPKYFEVIDELPKGSSGKILKKELSKVATPLNL